MRWRRGPLENGVFSEIVEMANERQNCQIINKNSNEMADGPFGKWPFWRKWRKRRLNAEIAKM